MKRSILIVITLIVLSFALFFLNRAFDKNDKEYVESYLEDDGFVLSEDESYYQKVTTKNTMDDYFYEVSKNRSSEYEEFYFYMGTYNFTKLKMNYNDNITNTFTASNDLVNNVITYKYEVVIYSSSIIVGGTYKDDKFKCEVVLNNGITEDSTDIYCSRAEYETLTFLQDSNDLKSNVKFSKIIKKGHEEVIVEDE